MTGVQTCALPISIASIWFIYNLTDERCVEIQQELDDHRTGDDGDATGATGLAGPAAGEK